MTAIAADVELQKAVFSVLVGDAQVSAALGRIEIDGAPQVALFDLVPQEVIGAFQAGQGITYAAFGESEFAVTPFDSDGDDPDEEEPEENEHILYVRVYSQAVGLIEVKGIVGLMHDAIKAAWKAGRIELPHYQVKLLDPQGGKFGRLDDGFTGTGTLTLRALISPK